jgi:lipopolysaccharide transport system permease protein
MSSNERVITAGKTYFAYFSEIWESRELMWILAKRDIIVKYKQTIIGIGWSALRPLITTIVMAFAFGKIGKLGTDTSIPFTLVVMPGVIAWLFSQSLVSLSQSLVMNANLITKVYFPRIIIPISTLFLGLVDTIVALVIFIGLCVFYQFSPDYKVFFVPIILIINFLAVFGIGLISAVLNVKFRDIGQLVPFIVQFGYFISPVGYTTETFKTEMSSAGWQYKLFCLNPVTGINDLMRWAMLGDFSKFNWDSFIPLVIFICLTSVFALIFFRKHENSFVDYI